MELINFDSYKQYVRAQHHTVCRRGMRGQFTDIQIEKISAWVISQLGRTPTMGLCHGARNGLECDEFKKHFPSARVIGTDLFPYSGKSKMVPTTSEVIACDFSIPNRRWVGKFDFVYSNSLDHAQDPIVALKVWFNQLTPEGLLLICWDNWHYGAHSGDCFGAELSEYIQMIGSLGTIVDLIYSNADYQRLNILRSRALETVVIGARKKQ